jgi:hypothetical protein
MAWPSAGPARRADGALNANAATVVTKKIFRAVLKAFATIVLPSRGQPHAAIENAVPHGFAQI